MGGGLLAVARFIQVAPAIAETPWKSGGVLIWSNAVRRLGFLAAGRSLRTTECIQRHQCNTPAKCWLQVSEYG